MTGREGVLGERAGEQPNGDESAPDEPFRVRLDIAQPVRLRDAVLGGSDNFSVDREAAGKIASAMPGGPETAPLILLAVNAFRRRAVRYLAREAGIRQFLPVGIGVPRGRTTRQIAQDLAPGARFVYCIDDPVALAHAHELVDSADDSVAVVHGGLRDPGHVLREVAKTFDLSQPVGMVLTTVTFLSNAEDPAGAIADLLAGLASGSHLVVAQLANDIGTETFALAGKQHADLANEHRMVPLTARSRSEVESFFTGTELLEPGLVAVDQWRPDAETVGLPEGMPTPFYGAVGIKP